MAYLLFCDSFFSFFQFCNKKDKTQTTPVQSWGYEERETIKSLVSILARVVLMVEISSGGDSQEGGRQKAFKRDQGSRSIFLGDEEE